MPRRDDMVPAARETFNHMRMEAMLAPPTDPRRAEYNDQAWADFGRRIYQNIEDRERFLKAIVTAMIAADGKPNPQQAILSRLKVYLVTGTIA